MAHSLDTMILTPSGEVALGEIQVGEIILDTEGGTQEVVSVTDAGMQETYTLTTSDGWSCKATEDQSIALYLAEEDDVTVGKAAIAVTEGPVTVPPLTVPSLRDKYSETQLFHGYLLGLMLQEPDPMPGYVSLVPDPVDLFTKWLPVPQMASAYGDGKYRLIYTQAYLDELGLFDSLEEARLFSGDFDKFTIPDDYRVATQFVRESLLRSFLPPHRSLEEDLTSDEVASLPYDHPGYGKTLQELALSVGWVRYPLRSYIKIDRTFLSEPTLGLEVSNPNGAYLLNGYLPMRGKTHEAHTR